MAARKKDEEVSQSVDDAHGDSIPAGEYGDTDAAQGDNDPQTVGQADVSDDRDTSEIGAPGEDARTVAESLVEVGEDGVPHAKGDTNAMLTGVNSDIVNPAFGGSAPGE